MTSIVPRASAPPPALSRQGQQERSRARTLSAGASTMAPAVDGAFAQRFLVGTLLAAAYVGASVSLITYNKLLMSPDVFPYAVALTMMHMVG